MTRHTEQGSGLWQAGAWVYSGRPDPRWTVHAPEVVELTAVWNELPTLAEWNEPMPRLGYRGCWLESPDGGRWIAHDRAIAFYAPRADATPSHARRSGPTEVRRDDERAFERALLATAPAGTPVPRV